MKGRMKIIQGKPLIFVENNGELKKFYGEEITIVIDGYYYFGKVIRYADRYVIYLPKTEPYEDLEKKEEFEFRIVI
jgi:hypothetical protein